MYKLTCNDVVTIAEPTQTLVLYCLQSLTSVGCMSLKTVCSANFC